MSGPQLNPAAIAEDDGRAGAGAPLSGGAPFDPAAASAEVRGALDAYLLALADDALLQGHRDSEWTGLGPILEEDIAFSSMAQDEIGHALVWYGLREAHLGAGDPDAQAFERDAALWRNAALVEQPRGDYATSLVRRTLYDIAKAVQYDALRGSAWAPLATAAGKLRQEKKYHLIHNQAYVKRLGTAGADSHRRLQAALDDLYGLALGLFEPPAGEALLVERGIAPASADLARLWLAATTPLFAQATLVAPADAAAATGGRQGRHTEHLDGLLEAMQSLHRSDPEAEW